MPLSIFVGLCFALFLTVVGVAILFLVRKPRIGFILLGILLAVAITAFVSWQPIYKTRTPRFAEDVKKVVDSAELQQWAMTILRETEGAEALSEIPRDRVPDGIRTLASQGSPFKSAWCSAGSVQERTVWLEWGGGFGHWGLRVGSPTFKVVPTLDDNYYVEWRPGIYFWHQTH